MPRRLLTALSVAASLAAVGPSLASEGAPRRRIRESAVKNRSKGELLMLNMGVSL